MFYFLFFYVYCRIPVSAFWGKWRIGVSPYRVPVSVSAYPCNLAQMKAYKKFQRKKIHIVASAEVHYFTMIVGQLITDGSQFAIIVITKKPYS
jgi:hypothetical protein